MDRTRGLSAARHSPSRGAPSSPSLPSVLYGYHALTATAGHSSRATAHRARFTRLGDGIPRSIKHAENPSNRAWSNQPVTLGPKGKRNLNFGPNPPPGLQISR